MRKFSKNNFMRECALIVHSLLLEGYVTMIKPTAVSGWDYYCKLKHRENGNIIIVRSNKILFQVKKNGKIIKQFTEN